MSKSEKANLDPRKFKPAIVYTIYIASTPAKVWQALTSAEFSRQYFSGQSVEVDQRIRRRLHHAYAGRRPA